MKKYAEIKKEADTKRSSCLKQSAMADNSFRSNRGMTMVEVLMGFTILLLLLAMFSGIISTSSDIFNDAADFRKTDEVLQKYIYKENIAENLTPVISTVYLKPDKGMPDEDAVIPLSVKLYKIDSSTLEPENRNDIEAEVYFLK